MKNIDELVDLVMEKIKSSGAYIEMSDKKLESSIYSHLNSLYQFEKEYAVIKYDYDRGVGKANKSDYAYIMKEIEAKVFHEAELIAITTQKELQHFI